MLELRATAARQYIDAVSVFEALEEALIEAAQVRGGMYWHKGSASAPEDPYLVRTTPTGGETSLGVRSAKTEEIYARFIARKQQSDERLAGLKASLQEHHRLNRALRVGRVDPLIVNILNRLAASLLGEHFRVVGTHALYAYEAAASITFDAEAVATRYIDLLWDTRKRVQFATRLAKVDSSMLGV
ncbi:MAG: GSU2403 family nucleotidyltransferase fold protein, partial [Variovorax sp.]|nr:GSU2403 family nucleotidyltransferase fold protein [Variovorax sp.]